MKWLGKTSGTETSGREEQQQNRVKCLFIVVEQKEEEEERKQMRNAAEGDETSRNKGFAAEVRREERNSYADSFTRVIHFYGPDLCLSLPPDLQCLCVSRILLSSFLPFLLLVQTSFAS